MQGDFISGTEETAPSFNETRFRFPLIKAAHPKMIFTAHLHSGLASFISSKSLLLVSHPFNLLNAVFPFLSSLLFNRKNLRKNFEM